MSDQELHALAEEARKLREVVSQNGTGGQATIHINAGGVGVWISATLCAVMLVSVVFLAGVVFWFAIKTNDQGHQMNALYMSVPGLRELVEKQMAQNEQTAKAAQKEEEK